MLKAKNHFSIFTFIFSLCDHIHILESGYICKQQT